MRIDQYDMVDACYYLSSFLFVMALGGLSHPESARRGNYYGMSGMLLAVVITFFTEGFGDYDYARFGAAIIIGSIVGILISSNVQMINMPQLVAALHSFVGIAATIIGFANYGREYGFFDSVQTWNGIPYTETSPKNLVETYIGVFIGAVTFSGSVVACGKLNENLSSQPLMLGGKTGLRHWLNALIIVAIIVLLVQFIITKQILYLCINCGLALFLGWHLVMAIGGADMPVVVSMLNSYSGWATSASGFMLQNQLLIISGALIGSSGAILSYIMCRAMNRSFISVIMGGFGVEIDTGDGEAPPGEIKEISDDKVFQALIKSKEVIIVPGYGMAVSKAQHAIGELVKQLKKLGIKSRFCIHAVAGRLPGHMNVLLAEANVPYDIVQESDTLNEDGSFDRADVVLIVGANDIVNPDALDNPKSPIAGMPVCQVWRSKQVFVIKRGLGKGYAAIENPLFYKENTWMYLGGAKQQVEKLLKLLYEKFGDKLQGGAANQNKQIQQQEQAQERVEDVLEDMSEYKKNYVKTIGVPKEVQELEKRVSLVPSTVKYLVKKKFRVLVENGAGNDAGISDEDYINAGADIVSTNEVWEQSQIIIKIRPPQYNDNLQKFEYETMNNCETLISYIYARIDQTTLDNIVANLQNPKLNVMALEETPRTTLAQKLDTISSVNNLIGYKGTLEGFSHLPRFSKGQTTAAGKIEPARVFVLGAGVAGLAAIGVARSMGAIVKAFDTRAATKEQIESLGGEYVQMEYEEKGEGAGGYGKEMSAEYYRQQDLMIQRIAREVDIIVTTALIPGKPAPKLISEAAVYNMKSGSVIVDCAAENGGNCELTKKGEIFITKNRVTIIGYYDFPSRMALQASELFSINMKNLIDELIEVPKHKENTAEQLKIDPENEIQSFNNGLLVCYQGEKTNRFDQKPAQQQQPAAQQQQQQQQIQQQKQNKQHQEIDIQPQNQQEQNQNAGRSRVSEFFKSDFVVSLLIFIIATVFWLVVGIFTESTQFIDQFGIFVLAIFTGYLVIWNVTPALHTPLMSETNAISGIIVAGCMVTMKNGEFISSGDILNNLIQNVHQNCLNNATYTVPSSIQFNPEFQCNSQTVPTSAIIYPNGDYIFVGYTLCAFLGLLFAAINIFGGFLVTHRMLKMFRKDDGAGAQKKSHH